MKIFRSALEMTSRLGELGLEGMEATLRSFECALGQKPSGPADAPPLDGPADVDAAASEMANRLLRVARSRWRSAGGIARAPKDVLDAARRSWPRKGRLDPRRYFALPLATATLTIQEALRGSAMLQAVRPALWTDFLDFAVEVFSELHVYFSLQYGEELERQRELVQRDPADAAARFELGRTYVKCGLYPEALAELGQAAQDRSFARRARYWSLVASYRMGDYRRALEEGRRTMELGGDERARHWLWLTSKKSGGYPEAVKHAWRMEAKDGFHPANVDLEDVARPMGLDKVAGGRGTAVFDATGDGRLDVAVAGAHAGVSLFRNNGDGTFTDVSTGSGLDRCVYGFGLAAGDYDNDGKVDLFVTGLGFFNGQGILFRNNGDATFTDVTKEAGLGCWGPSFVATWVDYDGDGLLDLFVVNNLGGLFDRKTENRLFHNNGDGTFTDVTREAGLKTAWSSIGAAWGDFSNDGRPDLFVSGLGRAQLFKNRGDGTFEDRSREAGVDRPAIGSVAIACDVDQDGWLDIVQMTYSRPQDAIHTLRHGKGPEGGEPPRVFRNNRDGTFTEIGRDLGLDGCWGTMSAAVGDYDNDGHLDLLLGNGDPQMDRTEASVIYQNDGERFRNVTFAAGMPLTGKGHGANMADLLGDGRMHLLVAAGGLYPGDLLTTTVHRPRERPGNYLNVRLEGTDSNRDAIGARLVLTAGGRDQHRLVSGGSGFGCMPYEQHFGLGTLEVVDRLEVRWPSGQRQSFTELAVNDTIRLVEGREGWTRVYPQ